MHTDVFLTLLVLVAPRLVGICCVLFLHHFLVGPRRRNRPRQSGMFECETRCALGRLA